MEHYIVKGGNALSGEVEIAGAKNAALAILAASIMTNENVTVDNVPDVSDIRALLLAIELIGARVEKLDRHTFRINGSAINKDKPVDNEFVRKIRGSYYLIGSLLGKYCKASVALPGGCNIGLRPLTSISRASGLWVHRSRWHIPAWSSPQQTNWWVPISTWIWFP